MKKESDFGKKCLAFIKEETVLFAAAVLAVISLFFVRPDKEYIGYIDYRVLGLLFSLMVVMAGMQELGFFQKVAGAILRKVKGYRGLCFVAVALCFFSSMVITNDVALITFVPLTILLLKMAGMEDKMTTVIVLQTVAANLGSMLTPIGNPQNLYLYAVSEMSLIQFLSVTAPLTCVSFVLLTLFCLLQKDVKMQEIRLLPEKRQEGEEKGRGEFVFFTLLFLLSILSVLRVIPFQIPLTVAVIGTFAVKKSILKRVDYHLLLTFVCFFVFIGNVGRIGAVREWLELFIGGKELLFGFLTSQVISNVPACMLLSGFTTNWNDLLLGVNIGGLGTLIGSLASLISYKFFAKERPGEKALYLLRFTRVNLFFAAILLLLALF